MALNIKNNNFLESIENWLKNFSSITIIILLLFFGLFNVFHLFDNSQALQLREVIKLMFLFVIFMFVLCFTLCPDDLKEFFQKNKNLKGYYALASLLGGLTFFLWFFSGFEGSLNTDVVYGVLTSKFFLFTYYSVVAFCETLIFDVLLYILIRHFAGANKTRVHIPSMVLTSLIFASYHFIVYSGNIANLIFAFVINCAWIWLVWQKDYQYLSGFMLAFTSHLAYNIAKVGAIATILLT